MRPSRLERRHKMLPFQQLFRSFVPLRNPVGFGARDFVELAFAILLVLFVLAWRPLVQPLGARLAHRTVWCMLVLAALPVALRLLLLPYHPVPSPQLHDEFSHLLVADTLSHFRLANPAHPLHQFFETIYVLQEPTYSSIYAMGQGMMLALGRMIFGHPWAGVLLSVAAFSSLCYWMLRAWTTPGWALIGGVLAVLQFGPLNLWMNGYWGGAVSAAAGCLVFGALPRLREIPRSRDAIWLGLGLGLQFLTRPYESILLVVSVMLFFLPVPCKTGEWRAMARVLPVVVLAVVPALVLTLVQNRQITGSWTTLPYAISRFQYGVPTTLTTQPPPVPHRELTPEQQLVYNMQLSFHGSGTDTLARFFQRLEYRIRDYRFFFYAPLYLALPFSLTALRQVRFGCVALCLAVFALGSNFYPFFFPHYIAAVTCVFVLVSVTGLERLSRLTVRGLHAGHTAARLILFLCVAHFVFWYGLHLFDNEPFSLALRQYETWNAINHGDPGGRSAIHHQLAQVPGKHLVFVRYWPQHVFQQEWVYNAADINSAGVVWARDLGSAENEKLRRYYPERTVWLLEPDSRPPKLTPYAAAEEPPTPSH